MDGKEMAMSETEKITINLGVIDLGQIDLLVDEGFYANRTDFIRTAIRNQLNIHRSAIDDTITRRNTALGVIRYNREDLEMFLKRGEKLEIRVVGLLIIDDDVTPELAEAVIERVRVNGVMKASKQVTMLLNALRRDR